MAWGMSTLHIIEALLANGAADGAHVVIDPMQTSLFHNAARRTLREIGVRRGDLDLAASNALGDAYIVTNPREVGEADARAICQGAW